MAFEIRVPRLGWTMESGTFMGWLKRDGESVDEGAALFTVEGEKAVQEVEAAASGVLRILPEAPLPGTTVAVGALLGYLVEPGELESFRLETSHGDQGAVAEGGLSEREALSGRETLPSGGAALPGCTAAPTPAEAPPPSISPRASRVASELGVDWKRLRGTGRTGRIVERDVRAAAQSAAAGARATAERAPPASSSSAGQSAGSGKWVPLSPLRRAIAERLQAAVRTAVPVTLTTEADATELVLLRSRLKASAEADRRPAPTVNDLFIVLTARALALHPSLNAIFEGDEILLADSVDLALAVDTQDGLLVPVLRDVQRKGLSEVVEEAKALLERTRSRRLAPDEMVGGTFTLTNLGMHGVDAFTPVLNPPQCAILGVGRIVRKPAVHDDRVVPRDRVTLSLTFDHRAVDGAPAARLLSTIRDYVERPERWLSDSPIGKGRD